MDDTTIRIIGVCATVVLAVGGWIFVYFHRKHLDSRAAQLERVNKQLRELYGPLYVTLSAGERTWKAFWDNHRPAHGQSYYFGSEPLTNAEMETWRLWMMSVFEPLNAKTEEIILKNTDLLESDGIPDSFVDALAHIAAYKAVSARWSKNDYSEHTSVNNWPGHELMAAVKPHYESLRKRQQVLLNT